MKVPLRVLVVTADRRDVQQIVRVLERDGYDLSYDHVDTLQSLQRALDENEWHIVIGVCTTVAWQGEDALSVIRDCGQDLPYILVCDRSEEQSAIRVIEAGAHDYVLRSNLTRLLPAVRRELRQAEKRASHRAVEDVLQQRTAQLEALRQVGLELATELDLDVLLHSIVSRAIALLNGVAGGMYLYVPEQDVLEWRIGIGPGLPEIGSPLRRGEGLSGKVWESEQPQIVNDYYAWSGRAVVFDDLPNVSSVGVLVQAGDEFLGVLNVMSDVSREFASADAELLSLFATQAASAVRNAQLYEKSQVRAERLAVVNRVARAVGAALQVDELLDIVYQEVCAIFRPDAFFVALYDEQTDELDFRLQVDEGVRLPPEREAVGSGLTSVVIRSQEPLIVREFEREKEHLPAPQRWGSMRVTPSWLGIPMLSQERLIGVISVQAYRPSAYDEQDQVLLSTIADQIAVAIERASLVQEVQESLQNLQETQEHLVRVQRMEAVGRLAGGIAHDFNNLLTAIQGYVELLLIDLQGSPAQADLYEIKRASDRAARLIQQLLAFSRKQMLTPTVLDLNELVREVESMLRRLIGEDILLRTVLSPSLGRVKADAGQIEQVIINLAVNARDAMPGGGTLLIETDNIQLHEEQIRQHPDLDPGPFVRLSVTDTGVGMDEDTLSRIFEPFFTTKELGKGTGLGLATVHGIVKQSGGDIVVYSENSQGTVFHVYLPCVQEALSCEPEDVPSETPGGHETILLVEDEDIVRELSHRILQRQGYNVLSARSPKQALELCAQYEGVIHMLVTDVVMPGMGGGDLAELVVRSRPGVSVLYTSGYTDDAIVLQGVLAPGVAFIQKPYTPQSLAVKVRETLDAPVSV